MATLLFIDTNIFLGFYEVSAQSDLAILERINGHHDRIITSLQVEMEFKKNRSQVIGAWHQKLKDGAWRLPAFPAYLATHEQSAALRTAQTGIDGHVENLRGHVTRIVEEPDRFDPVYMTAEKLFRDATPLNLTEATQERTRIVARARRRFLLGYPPRKDRDTAIGDAVNWEWIVHCAKAKKADVVIVSRDSDYGLAFGKTRHLNDWLSHEFRERVGRERTIHLTDRLVEGLKLASVQVSQQEQQAEENLVKNLEEPLRVYESRWGSLLNPSFAFPLIAAGDVSYSNFLDSLPRDFLAGVPKMRLGSRRVDLSEETRAVEESVEKKKNVEKKEGGGS